MNELNILGEPAGGEHHHCWRCGHDPAPQQAEPLSLFCQFCNTLQPPVPDYYAFFNLPRELALDLAELQRKFYALSRLLHPDRYTRAAERERRYSLEATAILNDGYRVLRDPVERAEYVLKEAGFDIGEQRSRDVPPELLEEVFELNMVLDELKSGDNSVVPQLDETRASFQQMLGEIDGELAGQFRRHDDSEAREARRAILEQIRKILNRRRYIRNLVSEVDRQLTAHGA
ncbi:MAG: DnaJ domain-containing protein [Bryobacteraceae bacterium]|nr:DnaJ domain-containing protein [Solibacteraceae bacterium]MCO5349740.1 DnaJ domain-containing protein [Bryobacteraceae bacterium]